MKNSLILSAFLFVGAAHAADATLSVPMNMVDEKGIVSPAGSITISESAYGLVFTPNLNGLPPGIHGFHVHENGSCEPGVKDGKPVAALGAGGHWDPAKTAHHAGPYGDGHLGDLPAIYVGADGTATYPALAPRLHSLNELHGHALMVHAGGDNHDDHPMPLGGGGARMACGVIK
jgi:Cu-Zn family superoxide dismutase